MATIGTLLNIADARRAENPNDLYADMIEMLSQTNQALQDIPMVECNNVASHKVAVRTGLPDVGWREINSGIAASKSSKSIVEFTTGQAATRSECDKDLADLGGNPDGFRMSEGKAHIQAMSQEVGATLFYGNEATAPSEFTGFARYYSALTGAATSENIVNSGGAGADNASIWLIGWGEHTIHGIYPKGLTAGLDFQDKGEVELIDANNRKYDGYASVYKHNIGLCLKDWRYAARLCNIDVSDLKGYTASDTAIKNLVDRMIELEEKIELGADNQAFYMNRAIITALRLGVQRKIINNLTWDTVGGKRVEYFNGIPVRRQDQLLLNESLVS